MAFKLFISNYTHRTFDQQRDSLLQIPELKDAPVYTPDDLPSLFRPTIRMASDTIYVASVACLAKREDQLRQFLGDCVARKYSLASIEEGICWRAGQLVTDLIKAWKAARANGAAKAGGRISAAKKEAEYKKACATIADRWGLPSSEWPTDRLLREAGKTVERKKMAYNTALKYLGKRPIAQYNYQAAQKRKDRKKHV